jgi:hypothetical protein
MIGRFFALLLFCGLCLAAGAQVKNYTLAGNMSVQGGETFSYKLVFSDSAGNIKGYSLTYQTSDKDTKAWITGRLDRTNKVLSFRETSIAYNNGFESNAIMCLVDAQLHYLPSGKTYVLKGQLTSKDFANADCAHGSINFTNDDVLKDLFSETQPAAGVQPPVAVKPEPPKAPEKRKMMIVYDTARARPAAAAPQPDKITMNVEKIYDWYSDTVVIDVWDGGTVDGDIISITYNDTHPLSHYRLNENKKQLRIPLSGAAVDVITIYAEEEGNEPPTTANMLLTDGSKQYPVIAYNNRGRQAVIRIRKAVKK